MNEFEYPEIIHLTGQDVLHVVLFERGYMVAFAAEGKDKLARVMPSHLRVRNAQELANKVMGKWVRMPASTPWVALAGAALGRSSIQPTEQDLRTLYESTAEKDQYDAHIVAQAEAMETKADTMREACDEHDAEMNADLTDEEVALNNCDDPLCGCNESGQAEAAPTPDERIARASEIQRDGDRRKIMTHEVRNVASKLLAGDALSNVFAHADRVDEKIDEETANLVDAALAGV